MNGNLQFIDRYRMTYEEWHGGPIRPIIVGSFEIVPAWMESSFPEASSPRTRRLVLDPGLVFGSGLHSTTRHCLEALEKVCYADGIASVADIGAGACLLAIAAVKAGCGRALAVDLNLLAARTSLNNIRLNEMEDSILAVQGDAVHMIERPFDLLIANIHWDVMKDLIHAKALRNKKWLILSGLLRSQARELEHRLANLPATIIDTWTEDGIWSTFLGRVNSVQDRFR